ncbi:MAG: hypothetical protein HQ567_26300 [Candidatus Nealsonbacteria bacterium]|nr:hypothetical protein [Candidatus Nealsonbacteria bacterium]
MKFRYSREKEVGPVMRWISSEGGPLLLLDERSLDRWGGVVDEITGTPNNESWSPGGKCTDYDRACRINEYLGRIPVGDAEALVLGDLPMQTAWIPGGHRDDGVLVRWMFAESEEEVVDSLRIIPGGIFRREFLFRVEGPKLLLFDSGLAGRNVKSRPEEYLSIELEPGLYQIETAVYEPDEKTCMVVHRFKLSAP